MDNGPMVAASKLFGARHHDNDRQNRDDYDNYDSYNNDRRIVQLEL